MRQSPSSEDLPIFYAIGDVHGEARRLQRLHGHIFKRHKEKFGRRKLILIHLGDYVDRGPDSCGVIETIIALEKECDHQIISLKGNHEQLLLDALTETSSDAFDSWVKNGGDETLKSYRHHGHETIPDRHLSWLKALPTIYTAPNSHLIFVHAGINVDTYPLCEERHHLWTRSSRFFETDSWSNPELAHKCIIHGHTPTEGFFPDVKGYPHKRVNIDTGAVYGGRLTAAIFAPDAPVEFFYA